MGGKHARRLGWALSCLAVAALVLLVYVAADNRRLVVREVTLSHPDLPPAFDGFTIVQVTDLHQRRFGEGQSGLIAAIEAVPHDLVLLTGDYTQHARDGSLDAAGPLLELVRGLKAGSPCCFVLGNYEGAGEYSFYPPDRANPGDLLAAAGARHIYPALRVDRGPDHIWLSDWSSAAYSLPGLAWPGSPTFPTELDVASDFIIAVTHRPLDLENPWRKNQSMDPSWVGMGGTMVDRFARSGELPWKMSISGHTHGGQFRLPGLGPLVSPNDRGYLPLDLLPRSGDLYVWGTWTDEQGRPRSISSGLGASGPPGLRFRLFDTPEVVVIHLRRG
jgi:predicted MPP superfamily phosphohydrolase